MFFGGKGRQRALAAAPGQNRAWTGRKRNRTRNMPCSRLASTPGDRQWFASPLFVHIVGLIRLAPLCQPAEVHTPRPARHGV
jgi:hypothetical protein